MVKTRSIKERLDRAQTDEDFEKIILSWVSDWKEDQYAIVAALDDAIRRRDWEAARSAAGQIHKVTSRRLPGIEGVIARLLAG